MASFEVLTRGARRESFEARDAASARALDIASSGRLALIVRRGWLGARLVRIAPRSRRREGRGIWRAVAPRTHAVAIVFAALGIALALVVLSGLATFGGCAEAPPPDGAGYYSGITGEVISDWPPLVACEFQGAAPGRSTTVLGLPWIDEAVYTVLALGGLLALAAAARRRVLTRSEWLHLAAEVERS